MKSFEGQIVGFNIDGHVYIYEIGYPNSKLVVSSDPIGKNLFNNWTWTTSEDWLTGEQSKYMFIPTKEQIDELKSNFL